MKVITLWQPWASFIMAGHKLFETRTWATRHRGPILIHASSKNQKEHGEIFEELKVDFLPFGDDMLKLNYADLPKGFILGSVYLVNCMPVARWKHYITQLWDHDQDPYSKSLHQNFSTFNEYYRKETSMGNYDENRFIWHLANPMPFDLPVQIAGKQGIWNFDIPHTFVHKQFQYDPTFKNSTEPQ